MANDDFTYDDATHTYRLNGKVIPSVTQVLKEVGLIDTRFYTEEGRERGKWVALVTELHDKGELNEGFLDDTMPDIRPYLDGWKTFRNENDIEILEIEEALYHDIFHYAGTPDRLVHYQGRCTVLDIKLGAPVPCYALQTAAYAECIKSVNLAERQPHRMCVYLKPEATPPYRVQMHADPNDRNVFFAALAVRNWKHNNGVKHATDRAA